MCYRLYEDTKMYFHCRWSSVNKITILFQNVTYLTTCFPSTGTPVHTSVYPALKPNSRNHPYEYLKKDATQSYKDTTEHKMSLHQKWKKY